MASESSSTLEPIKSHLSQQSASNSTRPPLTTVPSSTSQLSLIVEAGKKPKTERSRWLLRLQARMWRLLMKIGMFLHTQAPPRPIKPTFSRVIPTTISPRRGEVRIQFYTPPDYYVNIRLGKQYPVVVNFHGGGFTLGTATDDSRWASAVCAEVEAIVASVDYRLAPEFPFPTAVEDGVDAVMYLAANAKMLGINRDQIAISGFSSGANMAFTVPLRLQQELDPDFEKGNMAHMEDLKFGSRPGTPPKENTENQESIAKHDFLSPNDKPMSNREFASQNIPKQKPSHAVRPSIGQRADTRTVVRTIKPFRIAAIISWYPPTDYTLSRADRRATNCRPDQELSSTFTELFDQSYLPPIADRANPYLSPSVAPHAMLKDLPENIVIITCEYDSLLSEAKNFNSLLQSLGKNTVYKMVPGVPHAWDKKPHPFRSTPHVREFYLDACAELRYAFGMSVKEDGTLSRVARRMSVAVRKSLQVPRGSAGNRFSLGGIGKRGSVDYAEEYEDPEESRKGR